MAKSAKKIVEGRSKQQRQKVRKSLGKLKDLTVQPRTRQRYAQSLHLFLDWLTREGLSLPTKASQMDHLVSDYLEFLWATGEGKSVANNALAALQDYDPNLKKKLPGSWRLMKAWNTAEIPNRAPPLTLTLLNALCGWSVLQDCPEFGLSLRVGFFGLLRTGELLSVRARDVYLTTSKGPAVISLGLTKSGARQGAAESVTIHDSSVLQGLYRWKMQARPHEFLTVKPHAWRRLFNRALEGLKLQQYAYRPYSLRRGGATFSSNTTVVLTAFSSKDVGEPRKPLEYTLTTGSPSYQRFLSLIRSCGLTFLCTKSTQSLSLGPGRRPGQGDVEENPENRLFFLSFEGYSGERNPHMTAYGKW